MARITGSLCSGYAVLMIAAGTLIPAGDAGAIGRNFCEWQPGFEIEDLDGGAIAMTAFDDGSGPALFVGGGFTAANGLLVNRVARWDGNAWSGLNGTIPVGVDGRQVSAVAVFDDGSGPALFVGGDFTTAGGVTVNHIAKWDGSTWSALSGPTAIGTDGYEITALAVFDDGSGAALYAGGDFTTAGGVTVNAIARWDGGVWSPLSGPSGTGMSGAYANVKALSVFDDGSGPALYAGGFFETAGGLTVNRIARWNGSEWSALVGPNGSGVNGYVYSLTVFDYGSGPSLYAGGDFSRAGGVVVYNIAKWDGSTWSSLTGPSGSGTSGPVFALTVLNGDSGPNLVAGGNFSTAGGVTVNNIARWDGAIWSALSDPSGVGFDKAVLALAAIDHGSGQALYAGGWFTSVGGGPVNGIARWDGNAWSSLSAPRGSGLDFDVRAVAVYDDGTSPALYAGGLFNRAGNVATGSIARFDGGAWSALPEIEGYVYALAVFDDGSGPALYAGGSFATASGVTVNNIARWDGNAWLPLSGPTAVGVGGLFSYVVALEVFDDGSGPALYAGGKFTTAGGVLVNHIARWDGSAWWPLVGPSGTGVDGDNAQVYALEALDDGLRPALFVGGWFTSAAGILVNHVARWDGSEWSALVGPSAVGVGGSPPEYVLVSALAGFDDGSRRVLYAGGRFEAAGGVTANNVARWEDGTWHALAGPAATGVDDRVRALTYFDDGSGPALYAGGEFDSAGGTVVHHIARWDGITWSEISGPAGTGMDGFRPIPRAFAVLRNDAHETLFVGGSFTSAGGLPSSRIAEWRCPAGSVFSDDFERGYTTAWSVVVP